MTNEPTVGVGTAFFPTTDIAANGTWPGAQPDAQAGRLRRLPRKRRPTVIALAIALTGSGVVLSAALYQRASHQVPVVIVTAPVSAGAVITPDDLGVAAVNVGATIRIIPADQIGQVGGEVAAVALRPGTLLAPSELTSMQPPGPGQQLVPLALKPSALPASGLLPGDHVLVVPTLGDQGQPGSSLGSASLPNPVPGVVTAVNDVPDQDGLDVVDLLVSAANGVGIADQASTGQFALIVTKRGA